MGITAGLSIRGGGSVLSLVPRPSGRGWKGRSSAEEVGFLRRCCTPTPPARGSGERSKLLHRVRAEPGRQAILRQFQVKEADLVIPFHEFVSVTITTYYLLNRTELSADEAETVQKMAIMFSVETGRGRKRSFLRTFLAHCSPRSAVYTTDV